MTLDDKENKSLQIIKKELYDAKNPFIIFNGSLESLVLLHLIRQIHMGKIQIPVLYVDENLEVYRYIEKMRRLWRFILIIEEGSLNHLIKRYDIDVLFSFEDKKIESSNIVCPIQHFCEDDTLDYIKKYNIPCCSFYDKEYKSVNLKTEEEIKKQEDMIKKRFKELGYL